MEENLTIVTKKIFKIVRVLYFLLRKSISKAKLVADLSQMLKRGKIAGKAAIHSLKFHHHYGGGATTVGRSRFHDRHIAFPGYSKDYEFSCSNSPANGGAFRLNKRKHSKPSDGDLMAAAQLMVSSSAAAASPALPGFGGSPVVRQLRITDSPFPLRDGEEDRYVDEAAEEFIANFYKDLRQQNFLGYY
ncbi:uncharacterized protein LOC127239222 [Andrographis paniculata]|uniref:uncharacterized protein LOC127239222 n=1 Tax=Andrographis paniculata TaxID=175694 RepID=UPI0021E6F721|nr:uncharacterized protein LOC127239222 [Andrographis paniculata]